MSSIPIDAIIVGISILRVPNADHQLCDAYDVSTIVSPHSNLPISFVLNW